MRKLLEKIKLFFVAPDPEQIENDRMKNEIRTLKNFTIRRGNLLKRIDQAGTVQELREIRDDIWQLRESQADLFICLSAIQRKRKEVSLRETLKSIQDKYFKLTGEKID